MYEVSRFSHSVSSECSGTVTPVQADRASDFTSHAARRINKFIADWMERQNETLKDYNYVEEAADTFVFPLVQMGQLGVRQDERTTLTLLATAARSARLRLATGYFNLTGDYADTLLNACRADVTLLMAHPNANGFLNAKGIAGGIPHAYSLIAKEFWEQVCNAGQGDRVQMFEYDRKGWTFHAKGLWYYPGGAAVPWLSVVGSANLGERSVRRDLEAQAVLFTVSPHLQGELHKECISLHEHASECSRDLVARRAPLWVRSAVKIFRQYF